MKLACREAIWAIDALPLFQAASGREARLIPELQEPEVALKPMTEGREVVEDYAKLGLSLRHHPLSFLHEALKDQRFTDCGAAGAMADGKSVLVAGLVLIRQRPGSAKGVLFVTIEDETGSANLVIWPKLFEANRRICFIGIMLEKIVCHLMRRHPMPICSRDLSRALGLSVPVVSKRSMVPSCFSIGAYAGTRDH